MVKAKTSAKKVAPKAAVKKVSVKKIEAAEGAIENSVSTKKVVTTSKSMSSDKAGVEKTASVVKKGVKIVATQTNGVGRRKSSVARVWLKRGKGDVVVNGRSLQDYFPTNETRIAAVMPLALCQLQDSYTVKVNVVGGGLCSQADAVKLGVARALLKEDARLKPTLKEHGLLTVDSRLKERKKPGQSGARRKFQFVKR